MLCDKDFEGIPGCILGMGILWRSCMTLGSFEPATNDKAAGEAILTVRHAYVQIR